MKKFKLVSFGLLLSCIVLARPQAYEGFDYAKYQSIAGQNGGDDWLDSWKIDAANGVAAIKAPGLEYANLPVRGNCINMAPANDNVTLSISRQMNEKVGQDGTILWASFLVKANVVGVGHLFFTINKTPTLGFGKCWGNRFSIINKSGKKNMLKDQVYFVVVKYDFVAGHDHAYLWINPALDKPPATADAVVNRHDSNLAIGNNLQMQIQGHGQGNYDIDEIRVASSWAKLLTFGEWGSNAPNSSASIIASQGSYTNKIGIVWQAATGATKYALYRKSKNDKAALLVADDIKTTSYLDFSAAAGVSNYYRVKAGNPFGSSKFSVLALGWLGQSNAIDISGLVQNPKALYGPDANYCLANDAQFGAAAGKITGNIFFYNNFLTLKGSVVTPTVLSGALSGNGGLVIDAATTNLICKLAGSCANTLSGNYCVNGGTLVLAKDEGVDAIASSILLDGSTRAAVLELGKANQIADKVDLTIKGTSGGIFRTAGNNEKLGILTLQSHALIDLGVAKGALHFANSRGPIWKTGISLVIQNRSAANRIYFGNDSSGLSVTQLAQIKFKDPVGMPAGFYQAKISSKGEIVPTDLVALPFDNSTVAQTNRLATYDVHGRDLISGLKTPLKKNMVISCFGDSITWLDNANSYVNALKAALAQGEGTAAKNITVKRYGINGGTSGDILNGKAKVQASLQDILVADKPNVVTMYIGINDIWWAGTSPDAYKSNLWNIANTVKNNQVKYLVMATPWLRNELPDDSNINDAKIIQFAKICSEVATEFQSEDFNVVFLDLHKLGMNYLQNNNNGQFINYMPNWKKKGILTYDGVHSNPKGAKFLADQIAFAIVESMQKSK